MKHTRSLALVLAALAAPLFPQTSRAAVSFEYFQEALSPLGEWIEVADYGLCWRPTGVGEDWAPYTDGYWAYTDAGWTWVSYEDWGGITYHYGRWIHLVDEGWVWVPEYHWGPAWVSWRSSEDYVGWAPLPPEARWEESTGFSTWVDTSYDIGPDSYRFCHTRDFGAPVLAPVCVPCVENVTIILATTNVTNITYNHFSSVVFCGGPDFVNINRHCERPIPSLKLVCEDRVVRGDHGHRPPQVVRGNQLAVYAPKVQRPVDVKALPITPRRVVGAEKINRGWSRVPDLAAQQQIRERLQKQTAGLDPRTAPARPVRPADLSVVPKKAEPNAPLRSAVVRERNAAPPVSVPPQRPVATNPILPRVPTEAPPPVAERARPPQQRPVQPQPFNNPTPRVAERPPQVAVPEERSRVAEVERVRVQSEQQQQENARRAAIARQQQEDAQRSNALRNAEAQQQQNARRSAEQRSQQVPQPQNDAANQQQEARRQQMLQQRQQIVAQQQQENVNHAAAARQQQEAAQRANQVRQQQESAQRANEMRRQQVQQNEQQQAAQRANEMRNQQAQHAEVARQRQEAVQRGNEMRQQPPARQAEPPQRPQYVPPARPAPQQEARPAASQSKDGDDDKKKQRSGR